MCTPEDDHVMIKYVTNISFYLLVLSDYFNHAVEFKYICKKYGFVKSNQNLVGSDFIKLDSEK